VTLLEGSKVPVLVLSPCLEIPKPLITRINQGIVEFSEKLGLDLDVSIGVAEYGTDGKELDVL